MPREKRFLDTPPMAIGVLGVVTLVAGLILGLTNAVTAPRIAAIRAAEQEAQLKAALGGADRLERRTLTDDQGAFQVVSGFRASELVGRDYLVEVTGYGGPIKAIVSVDVEGKVIKATVLEQSETPGLGAKVAAEAFLAQYSGKRLDDKGLELKKLGGDIDAVTGATISSKAVLSAVREALATEARRIKVEGGGG